MIHFHSNMTFDEIMKEISYENYDLFIELDSRINQKIEEVYSKIESYKAKPSAKETMALTCAKDYRYPEKAEIVQVLKVKKNKLK